MIKQSRTVLLSDSVDELEDRSDLPCYLMPNEFIDHFAKKITPIAGMVYCTLKRFAGGSKTSWPSYPKIAETLGIHRDSVIAAVRLLEEVQLIKVEKRVRPDGGSTSNLYIILKIQKPQQEGGRNEPPGGSRNEPPGGAEQTPLEERALKKEQLKNNTLPTNGNGSSGLPIFGEQPKSKNTPPDRMSQTLYKALAEKRKIMRSPDLNKWSETFRKFMVESEASVQEVEFELAWYIKHIGQEFIPRACSAESFCERFVDIRDARLRVDPESEPKPKTSEFKAVVKKSTLSEEEFHKMIMDTDQ